MNCPYPTYDFCLWRGEDKELFFAFSYTDNDGNRQPMALDGSRFTMTLSLKHTKKVLDRLTSEAGRLVPGVLDGGEFRPASEGATALQVLFPHEVTAALDEADAVYELFKIDPEGKREMLLSGKASVHGGGYA